MGSVCTCIDASLSSGASSRTAMALSHRQRGTVSSYYGKINSHCLLTERPYFYFIICACCLDVVQVSCRRAFSPSRSEGCFTQRRAAGMAGSAPPSAWVPSASLGAPPSHFRGRQKVLASMRTPVTVLPTWWRRPFLAEALHPGPTARLFRARGGGGERARAPPGAQGLVLRAYFVSRTTPRKTTRRE